MATRTLKSETFVTSADGRRQGSIRTVLRADVYRVRWADGEETNEHRDSLLVRYTTTTPTEKVGGKVRPIIARGRIQPHVAGEKETRKAVAA
jgi:hypothetical protein